MQKAFAQQIAPRKPSVEETQRALTDLAAGNPDPGDAEVLADADVASAIPTLEKKFSSEEEPYSKGMFAVALVKLHDGDPMYWNYLSEQVEDLLKDPLPTSALFDAEGKQRAVPTEALKEWAKRHRVTGDEAG